MKQLFICCLIILSSILQIHASEPYYKNIGFELGNFTNWTGFTWIYDTFPGSVSTPKVQGIIPGRQTIISDTAAYDIKTGGKLRKIPQGYKYSARLGDAVTGALFESLSYTMKVDSTNALLVWKFAVVLQDPLANHQKFEEPRFAVTLRDQNGDTIPDCANYDVHVSDAKITGFQTNRNDTLPVVWRDWTTVGANLLAYMGRTITIEFMAGDCSREGHYGYAYFVADCQPLSINVKYCTSDSIATLTAPDGFEKYNWVDINGIEQGSERIIHIQNPNEGKIFFCEMTSTTGCMVKLQSKVVRYEEPKTDFTSSIADCETNTIQFTNLSTAKEGALIYHWDFGDGTTSTEQHPLHSYSTSGFQHVSLEVVNSAHSCSSILSKSIESFSSHLVKVVADSAYCPGEPTTLKAVGAHDYIWSTGSHSDSISVPAPGGKIWLVGRSSTGCISDTIFHTVYETPDWPLSIDGHLLYCAGQSTILKAVGGISYIWSTGETSDSIIVKTPGTYSVKALNANHCEKTVYTTVLEDPLPNVEFTLSTPTVDSRHNQLSCSIPQQDGVQYSWTMGDGTTETGSSIQHTYDVLNSLYEYPITLTATNENGCENSAVKQVDVSLFVSNVFSPNGEGVNDLFMRGVDLQVFDRNGLLLYKGTAGWNGTFNGKTMDKDTYFYLIHYTDKNKNTHTLKGYVTLMK